MKTVTSPIRRMACVLRKTWGLWARVCTRMPMRLASTFIRVLKSGKLTRTPTRTVMLRTRITIESSPLWTIQRTLSNAPPPSVKWKQKEATRESSILCKCKFLFCKFLLSHFFKTFIQQKKKHLGNFIFIYVIILNVWTFLFWCGYIMI